MDNNKDDKNPREEEKEQGGEQKETDVAEATTDSNNKKPPLDDTDANAKEDPVGVKDDEEDASSVPTSAITVNGKEVPAVPQSGVIASFGFPSLTQIAFGEPEEKVLKRVFFSFIKERAPDSS